MSPRPARRPDVAAVLGRLKGFQRDTAEYAFDRLYRAADSSRRFLVADEVGLGKTLVARGVLAMALDHLWDRVDRIDVVYICSNSQIAVQNVRRLQPEDSAFVPADRLTLLPSKIHGLRENKVNYLAFTPGTSFDLRSSMGRRDERVVLYHLVESVWPVAGTGPANLFQGWVTDADRWRRSVEDFARSQQIDRELARSFEQGLREPGKSLGRNGEDLRRRYLDLCHRFRRVRRHVPQEDRVEQAAFIARLRTLLAETCVQALEPDLIILDEFQRFKDVLDGDDEAARLARRLFTYSETPDGRSEVRLLLLSATPYKMYTLHHERDEEDHFRDFLRTVDFLDPKLEEGGRFRNLLDDYRRALYRIDHGSKALEATKQEIENQLRRVMARTERLQAAGDGADMLREVPCSGLQLTPGDVHTYLALEEIGREIDQPQVLEYWKSAPYLLSFMDDYKFKTEAVARLEAGNVARLAELLAAGRGVFLSWEEIEAYRQLDPGNARLRSLLEWVERGESWRLLWLPPSFPYYRAPGPRQPAMETGLSKRLVFSTWNVVPKAVASLVSYEVERRIFQEFDATIRNTPEERDKRRALLRFASTERLTGMPVLGILYPSPALAALGDPVRLGAGTATLEHVLGRARSTLGARLGNLTASGRHGDREDESWYWAAPILLDLESSEATTREWFDQKDLPARWGVIREDRTEVSSWFEHIVHARRLVAGSLELGRPPADLAEVLAVMSVAGPAVCALRALTRPAAGAQSDPEARTCAGQIAWAFRGLFNLPEVMALIRGSRPGDDTPYWRLVLDYCAAGHLQAVLDEYVHMLRDLEGLFDKPDELAWRGLAEAAVEALSLRTGTPSVDILPANGTAPPEQRRMRNHFAVRFGTQETDDGRAGAREGQVRKAFNSPFWPFVLTSTSVGQEGLDFHAYCHAVVHWNLPSNPVDLEQREGRVHRYKGHAVRKNVAQDFGQAALDGGSADFWAALFEIACEHTDSDHGLEPFWLYPRREGASIERHVPALPLSRDTRQLDALRRSLAVYRMVFGQPRQDDLMAFLVARLGQAELETIARSLRIDLAPRTSRP